MMVPMPNFNKNIQAYVMTDKDYVKVTYRAKHVNYLITKFGY